MRRWKRMRRAKQSNKYKQKSTKSLPNPLSESFIKTLNLLFVPPLTYDTLSSHPFIYSTAE